MVKAPLVTPDLEFGETILRHLDEASVPVSVVAWIRENDEWNLLIGTPLIEKVGERDTFQRLREAFSTERPVGISNLPIDILGNRSPLVRGIRKRFQESGAEKGDRFSGDFGPRVIDDGYIFRLKK